MNVGDDPTVTVFGDTVSVTVAGLAERNTYLIQWMFCANKSVGEGEVRSLDD